MSKEKKKMKPGKFILLMFVAAIGASIVGLVVMNIYGLSQATEKGEDFVVTLEYVKDWRMWAIGAGGMVAAGLLMASKYKFEGVLNAIGLGKGKYLEGDAEGVESSLENSRFLTDAERDKYFKPTLFSKIGTVKKDGVPVRALMNKKGDMDVNIMSGTHSLVIGASGSGKTTTFINPMIQCIGASASGSSMIISDPKGELFDMHSKFLASRGYNVVVLDLRNTYKSSRWNPLGSIWDMYQKYTKTGNDIKLHKDSLSKYPDLKVIGEKPEEGEVWAEWDGKAYGDLVQCHDTVAVAKQEVYDEMYEDLADMVAGICPITNEKDPLWEKGARSIVTATILAMLEDSNDSRLGMTKEKFNFYNVNKILTNSVDNYANVKRYFEGRDKLSQSYALSRQVMSAPDQTMSSYMSITFDKLSLFNDNGICGLTSASDIKADDLAFKPTALFLKIPDEKDTRHGLASLFILSMYKALIKIASARSDLSLPRNVYYILDEFGNMPKIEKFGQMITVGRSRKIWFNMVVQSYAQLNNVYGDTTADIVKSNCGLKMFIGSNDIGTCKEFSELCGNMSVKTTSTSSSTGSKEGEMSISTQLQSRPLIYPSELQKLNSKVSTGNAIIVTFGNYPLRTKYTPSYACKLYQFGRMDMDEITSHVFHADEAFYDIIARNNLILGDEE